ncbi:B12-binding domain-containing radical SAM protein [Gemmatimonadota bacterium]
MNLLLIDPATRDGVPELYENMGLAALAASARQAGHQTEVMLNHVEGWNYRRLGREIMRRQPEVLGISLLSFNARRTLGMLRRLKVEGLGSRVVVGGHFPTFNDLQLIQDWPEVDVVVRGEGDITLVELLDAWRSQETLERIEGITFRDDQGLRSTPPRALVRDLDTLPWPARDHTQRILKGGGTLNMVRSRGCYANCSFCSIASFYRTQDGAAWRQRSVEDVLDEMEALHERWPEAEIKFYDDQFIGPGKRGREDALAFAQALRDRGMNIPFYIFARADTVETELFSALKAAGLRSVFVGVESGSQRELDAFDKRISVQDNKQALQVLADLEIRFTMGLIFFDPYTEMGDVFANLQFLQETQPLWSRGDNVVSVENRVIVYKGTPFFTRLSAENRMEGDYMDYDYSIRDWRVRILCRLSQVFLNRLLPVVTWLRRLPRRLLRIGQILSLPGRQATSNTSPATGGQLSS